MHMIAGKKDKSEGGCKLTALQSDNTANQNQSTTGKSIKDQKIQM